jgi:hypothetical protein
LPLHTRKLTKIDFMPLMDREGGGGGEDERAS